MPNDTRSRARSSGRWRKSSYSGRNGECVEIADLPASVAMRDSKNLEQTPLLFDNGAWTAFVTEIKRDDAF